MSKSLDDIQKELDALASQRRRFTAVGLVFLMLLLTAIANANAALRDDETAATVAHLQSVADLLGEPARVPEFIAVLYPADPMADIGLANDEVSQLPPVDTVVGVPDTTVSENPPLAATTSSDGMPSTDDAGAAEATVQTTERDSLIAVEDSLYRSLEAIQDTVIARLAVRTDFLGASIPVTPTSWAVLLPFGFLAALAYLLILSERHRSLYLLGVHEFHTLPEDERSPLDHVRFDAPAGRMSAVMRHPAELTTAIGFTVALLIMIAIGFFLAPFIAGVVSSMDNYDTREFLHPAARTLVLFGLMLAAYVVWVRDQIRSAHVEAVGGEHDPNRIIDIVAGGEAMVLKLCRRLRHVLALAGATPVLLTLVLAVGMSVQQCSPAPAVGLEIFRGAETTYWYSAVSEGILEPAISGPAHNIGVVSYALALVFAVVALVGVIAAAVLKLRGKRLGYRKEISRMAIGTYLYVLVDTAMYLGFFNELAIALRLAAWVFLTRAWFGALDGTLSGSRDGSRFIATALAGAIWIVAVERLGRLEENYPQTFVGAGAYFGGASLLLLAYTAYEVDRHRAAAQE